MQFDTPQGPRRSDHCAYSGEIPESGESWHCPLEGEYFLRIDNTERGHFVCSFHAAQAIRLYDWQLVVIDTHSDLVASAQCCYDGNWADPDLPTLGCKVRAIYGFTILETDKPKVCCAEHIADFIDHFGAGQVAPLAFWYL